MKDRFLMLKTLNMLQSYLAYSKAKKLGAYDALLVNRNGFLTEEQEQIFLYKR